MGAHRKNPPTNASVDIERLAAQGFAIIGIAKYFKVSKETLKRWLDEDDELQEAFELGREVERQALHAAVYRSAMEGKGSANVNAFFLLKARHGYVEADQKSVNVNVGVAVATSVLVVKDHGTDEEWQAKIAAQQRRITAPESATHRLEAPQATPVIPALAKPAPETAGVVIPAPVSFGPPIWNHKH